MIERHYVLALLDRLKAAEKDTARLDWLFNNPMEALDILGYHRIHELQFVRSEIDAAMEEASK